MEARKSSPVVLASMTLAALLLTVLPVTTDTAYAQGNRNSGISVPVTGTATPDGGVPMTLTGTFTVHRFERASDPSNPNLKIAAVGTLVATTPASDAGPGRTIVTQVALPLVTGSASTGADGGCGETVEMQCEILNLVLGPLDLNLLGLRIELNQVILAITAIPGALLGDLLCSISGLLSGGLLGEVVAQVVALLNTLLGALG
jgi:hypothetical protein